MIGASSYDVFATDYAHYAGVFSCQPVPLLGRRHSVTLMARQPMPLSGDTLKQVCSRRHACGDH